MLRDFLTPEAFKLGIVRYLKQYSFQNTVNGHLWESLTNVSLCAYFIYLCQCEYFNNTEMKCKCDCNYM